MLSIEDLAGIATVVAIVFAFTLATLLTVIATADPRPHVRRRAERLLVVLFRRDRPRE